MPNRPNPRNRDRGKLDDVASHLARIEQAVRSGFTDVVGALVVGGGQGGKAPVNFTFIIPNAGGKTVKILPDVNINSQQRVPLDLNPIGPGGTEVDETIHGTVTSSAPEHVGVTADAGSPVPLPEPLFATSCHVVPLEKRSA
mgnify:CR=1 FL=1